MFVGADFLSRDDFVFRFFFWQSKTFFYNADLFFTIVFAVELLTNLFSHWFWRFWR